MSPEDARRLLLRTEIEREWSCVHKHMRDAKDVDPSKGRLEAAFVSLALDHAYQAFESLLERLERGLGLPAREGATWHQALLAALA